MKKTIYFTSTLEINDDGILTEMRIVNVYDIIFNIPELLVILEMTVLSEVQIEIQNYLNDNGHGDEDFEFIKL